MPTQSLHQLALLTATALCLTLIASPQPAHAADCAISQSLPADPTAPPWQLFDNGTNGGVAGCAPDQFEAGDTLILEQGAHLRMQTRPLESGEEIIVTNRDVLMVGTPDLEGDPGSTKPDYNPNYGGIGHGVDNGALIINGDVTLINTLPAGNIRDKETGFYVTPRIASYFGHGGLVQNNGTLRVYAFDGDPDTEDGSSYDGTGGEPRWNNALDYTGNNGMVVNNGTIETRMRNAHGMRYAGDNGLVVNNGTIEIHGYDARALLINGANGHMINTGTILTTGKGGYVLLTQGEPDGLIENFGTVETTGVDGDGVFQQSYGGVAINHAGGEIETKGNSADAMATGADYSRLINYGSLMTRGNDAIAMTAFNDNVGGVWVLDATLENHGHIEVHGYESFGMHLNWDSDGGRLINHGSIRANGERSAGVLLEGIGHQVLENFGTIGVNPEHEGDDRALAVRLNWEGPSAEAGDLKTIILHDSSVLIGWAESEYPELTRVRFGLGFSGTLHFDKAKVDAGREDDPDTDDEDEFRPPSDAYGLNDWRDLDNADELVGFHGTQSASSLATMYGGSFYAADMSDLAAQDHLTFDLTRSLSHAVEAPAFYDADRSVAEGDGGGAIGLGCTPWITPFGGYLANDGNDDYLGFDGFHGGVAAGCMLDMGIGLFAGGTYGKVDADDDKFSSQSFGGFLGAYGATEIQDTNFGYMLTLGYMHNDNERLVTDNLDFVDGKETLSGTHGSFYVTPSMTAGSLFGTNADLTLSYTGVFHGEQDYLSTQSEAAEGQAYHLVTDSRYSQSFNMRSAYTVDISEHSAIKFGGGLSYLMGGDVDVTLMDTNFEVDSLVDEVVLHASITLTAEEIAWMTLGGSVGDDGYSLSASARYQF